MEGELEEATLTRIRHRREHADDVAVVKRRPLLDALQLAVAPEERAVNASAVDDDPARSDPFERAMRDAGDEELGVRLQGDVVGVGEPTDREEAGRVEWVPMGSVLELVRKGEVLGSGSLVGLLYVLASRRAE